MAHSECAAVEPLAVTAAVRRQYSGMLWKGVNQELGEQRGAQSSQDCHTSGQLPSEGPAACATSGRVLFEPWGKPGKPGPQCCAQGLAGRHVGLGGVL